jgi:hypothetical protein
VARWSAFLATATAIALTVPNVALADQKKPVKTTTTLSGLGGVDGESLDSKHGDTIKSGSHGSRYRNCSVGSGRQTAGDPQLPPGSTRGRDLGPGSRNPTAEQSGAVREHALSASSLCYSAREGPKVGDDHA